MYISFHFIQEQSLLGITSHLTIFAKQIVHISDVVISDVILLFVLTI